MKLIRHFNQLTTPVVATIGNFDGVHLGHQAMIKTLAERSQELGLPSLLITFEPTPQEYFLKNEAPARLTRLREKLLLLQSTDIDYVMCLKFDADFASISASNFIQHILKRQLQVQHLLVGDDFRFGCDRQGNIDLLKSMQTDDFRVEQLDTFLHAGQRVSSTSIRQLLAAGHLTEAKQCLGRAYSMSGKVVHGNKRGRQIGFPTANIELRRYCSPIQGVYAVNLHGLGVVMQGVANVGNRPTVDGVQSLLEVHLLDFKREIYGENLQVEFCAKLRDEIKFDSIEQLRQQISDDVTQARDYFE